MKKVDLKIEEAGDRTRWKKGGESDRGWDEVYSTTFGDEEKTN